MRSRCFVHILNSVQFLTATGNEPPQRPPTAREYTEAGLPWFDHYGGDLRGAGGREEARGHGQHAPQRGSRRARACSPDNEPVIPAVVRETFITTGLREGRF